MLRWNGCQTSRESYERVLAFVSITSSTTRGFAHRMTMMCIQNSFKMKEYFLFGTSSQTKTQITRSQHLWRSFKNFIIIKNKSLLSDETCVTLSSTHQFCRKINASLQKTDLWETCVALSRSSQAPRCAN